MKYKRFVFAFLLCLLSPLLWSNTLKVGVKDAPPFSFYQDGEWQGMSIELWKQIQTKEPLQSEWIPYTDLDSLLKALEAGDIDLIASSVSVTPEREKRFDFSHPFLSSNLAILAKAKAENKWISVIKSFISWPFFAALGSLALVLLGAGSALYFFERKANPDEFSPLLKTGLGDSFWWAAVTMTTVGYGDKSPKSTGGRIIALIWMFLSVIILSTFTASIVNSLAEAREFAGIQSADDLRAGEVVTISGSVGEAFLNRRQVHPVAEVNLKDAINLLKMNDVQAFVHDKPILQHLLKSLPRNNYYIIDLIKEREAYALVFQHNSPLREPINQSLLKVIDEATWHEVEAAYVDVE